jgi:hypothetical protein
MDVDSDERFANGLADRITVKIADLGNGVLRTQYGVSRSRN